MWQPLVQGDEARVWRERVAAIAAGVASATSQQHRPGSHTPLPDPTSLALLWAYATPALNIPAYDGHLERALEALVDHIGAKPAPVWLHGGSLGAAWTVQHILDDAATTNEILGAYDDYLLTHAQRLAAPNASIDRDAGLIAGIGGLLFYAAERWNGGERRITAEIARHALTVLAATASPQHGGIAWPDRSPPKPETVAIFPNGVTFCGPGHGVSGVIGMLGHALQSGIFGDSSASATCAFELIRGGQTWLTATAERARQATPHQPAWQVPHTVGPGAPPIYPQWLAWCSGALAVAMMRWQAALAAGDDPTPYRDSARACADLTPAQAPVRDAGLCHGALGHAQLFNRCYQATGDDAFAQAARRWLEHATQWQTPSAHYGGFFAGVNGHQVDDPSFLQGAIGIALGICACLEPSEPRWDRLLGVCEAFAPQKANA